MTEALNKIPVWLTSSLTTILVLFMIWVVWYVIVHHKKVSVGKNGVSIEDGVQNITNIYNGLKPKDSLIEKVNTAVGFEMHSFDTQRDKQISEYARDIDGLKDKAVTESIHHLLFTFPNFLDPDKDPMYQIKKDTFELALHYEFNKKVIEKLDELSSDEGSEFDEMGSPVEDVTNAICQSIENSLDNYEVFQKNRTDRSTLKKLFDEAKPTLKHNILDYLNHYRSKSKSKQEEEKILIKERNDRIAFQLESLLASKEEAK